MLVVRRADGALGTPGGTVQAPDRPPHTSRVEAWIQRGGKCLHQHSCPFKSFDIFTSLQKNVARGQRGAACGFDTTSAIKASWF